MVRISKGSGYRGTLGSSAFGYDASTWRVRRKPIRCLSNGIVAVFVGLGVILVGTVGWVFIYN